MLPYFVVAGAIGFFASISSSRKVHPIAWSVAFLVILVFVGLRHHVGMDWNNYLVMIDKVHRSVDLIDAFNVAEPGFVVLLWFSGALGFGVYGSNLVGTLIFCIGLFKYARRTELPWVALMVAIPMLVTVVAMSANRQAIAIGVLLWAVADWQQSSMPRRVAFILAASMFHYSALFFLIFVFADLNLKFAYKFIIGAMGVAGAIYLLQTTGRADYYDSMYFSGQTALTRSEGAKYHVLFNGGPALLYFLVGRSARERMFPDQLHRQMAFFAIGLIPLVAFASLAAGRITLYLFPVAMCALSAAPQLIKGASGRPITRFAVVAFMLTVLYIWLGYANSAGAHLPYGNMLTEPPSNLQLCCG